MMGADVDIGYVVGLGRRLSYIVRAHLCTRQSSKGCDHESD
jgi:hypothetical protein